jgi:D-amino-acid dehydrogenase
MSKDVIILGAGVIGLSTAYYAAKAGHRVTVLDRAPETRDGCSFGNAGMIVPSHFIPLAAPGMVALGLKWMWNPESPFYIKPRLDFDLLSWGFQFWQSSTTEHVRRSAPLIRDLSLASRACFEEFAKLPDTDFGLVQRGLLMLCKSQHALDDEAKAAAHARQLGIPAEVLDARATAAQDPGVHMDVAGSVFFPKDCHLSPGRFMEALKRQILRAGGRFLWNTEITGWNLGRENQIASVDTSHGKVAGDEFVLCGGSWTPLLAEKLGLHLPMQAGKGYSLTLTQPRELPQLCSIFTEARVAITPMGNTLRFGGTMEMAGLNEDINPVRVQGIIRSIPKYFPHFEEADFSGIQPWRGLRPCSPDGLPYLGRTQRHTNLTIASGHAMMGLSLGPITGRIVAELLSGTRPSLDIGLLAPNRFD